MEDAPHFIILELTCLLDESDPNYNYHYEIEVAVVIVAVSLVVIELEQLMDIAVNMTVY